MNDIQMARDVLAKWRGEYHADELELDAVTAEFLPGSNSLIMGTAANLDLLDAIDDTLAMHVARTAGDPLAPASVRRIAAAIITADERMQQ